MLPDFSKTIVCLLATAVVTWMAGPAQCAGASVTSSGLRAALLVIDVQECFLPGGSLAVNEGRDVIPIINWIRKTYEDEFSLVAFTKDWHCDRHVSFATSHSGKQPFDEINLRYLQNESPGSLTLGSWADVRPDILCMVIMEAFGMLPSAPRAL